MTGKNNATLTRREVFIRLWQILDPEKPAALEDIDRIPLQMRTKKGSPIRCCVYKDRAVLKYKIMAMLGFNSADEKDELDRLSDYFMDRLKLKNRSEVFLTVADEACSACHTKQYVVTNMCRGCEARPCMMNCPKGAITVENNHAEIDYDKCVNCGLCQKHCPYHAITFLPVPCEEVCPVGAISKNEEGIETIDMDKCILCGKCISSCPFGAIIEKSFIPDIYREWTNNQGLIALVAPALDGQFRQDIQHIYGAIIKSGFHSVAEVAWGADLTAMHEADELKDALLQDRKLLTSSCCPSYKRLANNITPDIKPFVSETLTPMAYTARRVKELWPHMKTVFISPCVAKKYEAHHDPNVDYVLSVEELGALFAARDIQPEDCTPAEPVLTGSDLGHDFSLSGGVSKYVDSACKGEYEKILIDGIDKKSVRTIKAAAAAAKKDSAKMTFMEVMACQEGCIGGCDNIVTPGQAKRMR